MTVLVGFHVGTHVVLAADTRVTYYPPGLTPHHEDGKQKIREVPGMCAMYASQGYTGFGDAFFQRLAGRGALTVEQMTAFAREERAAIEADLTANSRVLESLDGTGGLLAFLSCFENETFLRLVHCYGSHEFQLWRVEPRSPLVALPDDVKDDIDSAKLHESLAGMMERFDETEDGLRESLAHHARLASGVIQFVAQKSETVSPTCHVGALTVRGHMGISEPFGPGDDRMSLNLVVPTPCEAGDPV